MLWVAMTVAALTRRSLLAATGTCASAALVRPSAALAALAGPGRAALFERRLGEVSPGTHTIALARSADLLGLQWQAPAHTRVQMRFLAADGRWSEWAAAGASGHGPDVPAPAPARVGASVGEPVWSGGTDRVQLRAEQTLRDVRLHLIDVSDGLGAHRAALAATRSPLARLAQSAALPLAAPNLQAGPGQPPIIARRAWARGFSHPRVAPGYGAVELAFVHHTENPNGYLAREVPAMLRAIFLFHRDVHGWNDIGYNFVIDAFGRIFEARAGGIDEPVVGAHAGGYNLVSSGVAVLGSFGAQPLSAPARRSLQQLLAWKLSLHGTPSAGRLTVRVNPAGAGYSRYPANARVSLPRIAGHRDADSTDCPGDALYRELGGIRASVRRLAPQPVLATIALTPPPSAAAPAPAGAAAGARAGLAGSVTLLGGAPVAGAIVQIQARAVARRGEVVLEQTLAQAQCDAAGRWSLPASIAPASGGVSLRALYAGAAAGFGGPPEAGAAVSAALFLPASALTAPAAAPPTPAAAPAPAP